MSYQITNKFVAAALALVMNGLILGGVSYMFDAAAANKSDTSMAKSEQTQQLDVTA
jgi:hypothetical protein